MAHEVGREESSADLRVFFALPLLLRASAKIHWICPLTERNSSSAHASIASIVALSTRRIKLLVVDSFFATVAVGIIRI